METEVRGLREDVQALTEEQQRTRQRLHSLEATLQGVVKTAQGRGEEAARIASQTQRWIQVLALLVALAGVVGPLIYSGVAHH